MIAAEQAALLGRACRFLQAQFAPLRIVFRTEGDAYDHTAQFEWPGVVAVYWEGELQCRSAIGDLGAVASAVADLYEAGIDQARAISLLQHAVQALRARYRTFERQMPGMRTGQPAYLVEFRWPGFVRVLSFRSKEVLAESKTGDPAELTSASRPAQVIDHGLWADERDPVALERARRLRRAALSAKSLETADARK